MSTFTIEELADDDQRLIKRGICPSCQASRLVDVMTHDECPECGDSFVGKLTIED